MAAIPTKKMSSGYHIPVLGLGTWQGPPGKEWEVGKAVKDAIDVGYRSFDCAHVYENEHIIGEAIAEKIADGTVKREDLFITSKLWNTYHRPEQVEPALRTTLKNLKLDYLDLYLVHWPYAIKEGDELWPRDPATNEILFSDADYVETWKAMEEINKKGLARTIGISNFNSLQIDRLLKHAKVHPAVNQIECHPYLNQKKLRAFCEERGILVTAYSPLGSPQRPWQKPGDPDVMSDQKLKSISEKYGKSVAQVLLRYQIQLGNITIPKSSNKKRMLENMSIFDFCLAPEDVAYINTFDCNGRICPHEECTKAPNYPFSPDVEF